MNDEINESERREEASSPASPVYFNTPVYTTVPDPEPACTAPQPSAPKKEKKPRRTVGWPGVIALCLVCTVLAGVIGAGTAYLTMRDGHSLIGNVVDEIVPTPVPVLSTNASEGAMNETANYIYNLACTQVVGITTEITYYNIFGQVSAAVAGSGFIISDDGYILTNYHVIEDAYEGGYEVSVMMYSGDEYTAEIVGFDEDSDLAVLKIEAQGLAPAELGDTDDLSVGQIVYTVGNPLGELTYTMTSGIVSATDRTITTGSDVAVNMFQIDAAVNSGNSGGPVYNSNGQVIGIVTAKYSSTGVEGIGFAIPISDAVHIANQILEFGYVTDKAYLGITPATVTSTIAKYYNMVEGVYVNSVEEGSAAENAGIQTGDIITAIDGTEITDTGELTSVIKQYHAGEEAQITVWRNQESVTLTVVFDEKLPEEESEEEPAEATQELPSSNQQGSPFYPGSGIEDFFRQFFGYGF